MSTQSKPERIAKHELNYSLLWDKARQDAIGEANLMWPEQCQQRRDYIERRSRELFRRMAYP